MFYNPSAASLLCFSPSAQVTNLLYSSSNIRLSSAAASSSKTLAWIPPSSSAPPPPSTYVLESLPPPRPGRPAAGRGFPELGAVARGLWCAPLPRISPSTRAPEPLSRPASRSSPPPSESPSAPEVAPSLPFFFRSTRS
jgi:hypothetical protein